MTRPQRITTTLLTTVLIGLVSYAASQSVANITFDSVEFQVYRGDPVELSFAMKCRLCEESYKFRIKVSKDNGKETKIMHEFHGHTTEMHPNCLGNYCIKVSRRKTWKMEITFLLKNATNDDDGDYLLEVHAQEKGKLTFKANGSVKFSINVKKRKKSNIRHRKPKEGVTRRKGKGRRQNSSDIGIPRVET